MRFLLWTLLVVVGGLTGCASVDVADPPSALIAGTPSQRQSVADLIASLPMNGENIVRHKLADGSTSSVFLVRMGDREEPHRHTRYDMTVTVVEGLGTMWIDGAKQQMVRGDVAHVPRGIPHYFVNQGSSPAAALVVFSPAFSGPDSETTAP